MNSRVKGHRPGVTLKGVAFFGCFGLSLLFSSIFPAFSEELPKAMWVWDAQVVVRPAERNDLLAFCREKHVGILYLSAYNLDPPYEQNYRIFNALAHKQGIEVHALAGDPRWGRSRYHDVPLRWIKSVQVFNASGKKSEQFDGIHTDIEVYLLSRSWRDEPARLLGGYLDLHAKIAKTIAANPQPIHLGVDVPFWFDDDSAYRILWNGQIKAPSHHILDTADSITVLAYRNFSEGLDGTLHLVRLELAYADQIGKPVVIGQETQTGLFPQYVTFGGTSCDNLHEEMDKIKRALEGRKSFNGFAIHHYESYRELCS